MTKTIRCYNKPTWIKRMGFGHPYKQICMGTCKYCRNPKNDYKIKRKHNRNKLIKYIKRYLKDEYNFKI